MPHKFEIPLLHLAHFFCHYFLLIFPTVVIAIERDLSIGYGEALILGTPLYACFALGTLPAGWLGDRYDRSRLVAISFIGCGLSALLIGLVPDGRGIYFGLGALGLFTSIYHPVGLSRLTELGRHTGRLLAVNGIWGNMGLACAAAVTGVIAAQLGWQAAFTIPGVISIGLGIAYLRLRPADAATRGVLHADASQTAKTIAMATRTRVVLVVLLAALFGGFIFNGVTVSLPKLLELRLLGDGGNLAAIGGYTALVFAIAAFAQLPVGLLLDRFGGRIVFVWIYSLELAALAILSVAQGPAVVAVLLAVTTLMFASIPISGWLLAHFVDSAWRSRAFSVEYLLSLGVGSAVVPVLAMLHQAGYGFDLQLRLYALCAFAVLGLALLLPAALPSGSKLMPESGS